MTAQPSPATSNASAKSVVLGMYKAWEDGDMQKACSYWHDTVRIMARGSREDTGIPFLGEFHTAPASYDALISTVDWTGVWLSCLVQEQRPTEVAYASALTQRVAVDSQRCLRHLVFSCDDYLTVQEDPSKLLTRGSWGGTVLGKDAKPVQGAFFQCRWVDVFVIKHGKIAEVESFFDTAAIQKAFAAAKQS